MPSNMLSHCTPVLVATAVAFVFAYSSAIAQTEQRGQPLPPVATPPATKQPAAAGQKAGTPAAAKPGSEAALQQRVDQLEEQLIDLQVVIGTLESLAKTPTGQAAPAAADAQRIQALEAQLKSLSTQIEQLGEKVRGAGEPTKRSEAAPPQRPQNTAAATAAVAPTAVAGAGQPSTASLGSATVTSSRPDEPAPGSALPPIGADGAGPPSAANAAPPPAANPPQKPAAPDNSETAALPPSGDPGELQARL